jgi:DNA-binding transcriptional LysR family regulator
VLPGLAVWDELRRGELVAIAVEDAELPPYEVALVQWPGRALAPAAQTFAELVRGARVSDLLAR